jgi:hypothetical protein
MTAIVFTASSTTDQLTATAHGLNTGDLFHVIAAGGTLPTAASGGDLVEATDYFAIRIDANNVKVARSQALAQAGTAVDLTSNGSGQMYLLIGLPFTRARTYANGVQVWSADLNALQDDVVGNKRAPFRRNIPLTLSFVDTTNTWAANGIGIKSTSATGSTTIGASYCDCPYDVGDVILGVEVWRKSDGTSGNKSTQFILAAQDNNILIATSTDTIANTSTTRTGPFVVASSSGIGRMMQAGETLHFAFVSQGGGNTAGYIILVAQLVVMRP